jgi:hypothetical protein
MGFDSLYAAAYFTRYGPSPLDNPPLIVKSGERAYLAVPATLARMATRTHYVGGSQGFSFPVGHTGIRYRVGTFRGHPVHEAAISDVDTGTLVLTNLRLAFVGRTKSVAVPYTKLMHVEAYSDALAVFNERRENPDFYKIGQPKWVLFHINWLLQHPNRGAA